MSLDDIPGLGALPPPGPRRRPRRWLHCLVWALLWALSWALWAAVGFLIGCHVDDILAWVGHVAPGWHH